MMPSRENGAKRRHHPFRETRSGVSPGVARVRWRLHWRCLQQGNDAQAPTSSTMTKVWRGFYRQSLLDSGNLATQSWSITSDGGDGHHHHVQMPQTPPCSVKSPGVSGDVIGAGKVTRRQIRARPIQAHRPPDASAAVTTIQCLCPPSAGTWPPPSVAPPVSTVRCMRRRLRPRETAATPRSFAWRRLWNM
jgi:hypothetical protein